MRYFHIALFIGFFALASVTLGQDADRSAAIEAFKAADYSKAIELFTKVVKVDPADAQAWHLLGSAYFLTENYRDSTKVLAHAAGMSPADDELNSGFAKYYLRASDKQTYRRAAASPAPDPTRSAADYVMGVLSYRGKDFAASAENANKAIESDPQYAVAYRLRADARLTTLVKPPVGVEKASVLTAVAADLEKYLELTKEDDRTRKDVESELRNIKAFADRFSVPEKLADPGAATPIKILSKPRPGYTDEARASGVEGTVTLLVEFEKSGKVGAIVVLRKVGGGLDEQVIRVARNITFSPEIKDGVPVTVIKQIEYAFSIY